MKNDQSFDWSFFLIKHFCPGGGMSRMKGIKIFLLNAA